MLSGSRNIIRIVSRQHNNGARLLAASQQHRTSQPGTGARLHTQLNINNNKVSRTWRLGSLTTLTLYTGTYSA